MGTHFSYGSRYATMWELGKAAGVHFPQRKIQVDKNGTRVAARHNLLNSELYLANVLPVYHAAKEASEKLKWSFTADQRTDTAQIEATLHVTQVTTKLAQFEQDFTGAYDPLIKGMTIKGLESPMMRVVNLSNIPASGKLERHEQDVSTFRPLGSDCRERAMIEAQRRFCEGAEKTEVVIKPTPPIIASKRSLVATILDLRTVGGGHLTKGQYDAAGGIL